MLETGQIIYTAKKKRMSMQALSAKFAFLEQVLNRKILKAHMQSLILMKKIYVSRSPADKMFSAQLSAFLEGSGFDTQMVDNENWDEDAWRKGG